MIFFQNLGTFGVYQSQEVLILRRKVDLVRVLVKDYQQPVTHQT
jgi:hypothetical protein